jgi:MFS family permease
VQLLADLSPLRESPPFRRLWAGTAISGMGNALTTFAASLQVFDITRSTAAVGLIGLVTVVPLLAVGPAGGALIDAVDKRRLAAGCTAALAAVSALFTALAWAGLRQVVVIYALLAVAQAVGAVNAPARQAITRALLPAARLPAGLALQRVTFQVTLIVGPAVGGLITAAPHLGLRGCYLADTVSYAAACYGVARLPAEDNSKKRGKGGDHPERARLSSVIAGLAFIRRTPVLAGAFAADLSATFFGLPTSLFQAINAQRFGGDPRTLGLFTAAIGVGGLVTAVLSGPLRHVSRLGLGMVVAVAVWGAAFAVFAVAGSLWLSLLTLGVAGAADTVTVVLRGTIVGIVTPQEFRGRVMAADFVVGAGGGQLGSLEAGVVGSLATPAISALSGGVATIASVAVLAVALPAFTRYTRPPEPSDGTPALADGTC